MNTRDISKITKFQIYQKIENIIKYWKTSISNYNKNKIITENVKSHTENYYPVTFEQYISRFPEENETIPLTKRQKKNFRVLSIKINIKEALLFSLYRHIVLIFFFICF